MAIIRSLFKDKTWFFPHRDLNCDPLEPNASVLPICFTDLYLLCILTSKRVLCMPFAGQNLFFCVKTSFSIFFSRKPKKERKLIGNNMKNTHKKGLKLIKNTLIVRVNYYDTVNPSLWKVPWVTSWKAHSVQIQMYTTEICALFGGMLFRSHFYHIWKNCLS